MLKIASDAGREARARYSNWEVMIGQEFDVNIAGDPGRPVNVLEAPAFIAAAQAFAAAQIANNKDGALIDAIRADVHRGPSEQPAAPDARNAPTSTRTNTPRRVGAQPAGRSATGTLGASTAYTPLRRRCQMINIAHRISPHNAAMGDMPPAKAFLVCCLEYDKLVESFLQ